MSEIRIPGYCEGSDLGGEPVNWLIVDRETGARRVEANPNYVPSAPPTELELAEWELADAEWRLGEAKAAVARLREDFSERSSVIPQDLA